MNESWKGWLEEKPLAVRIIFSNIITWWTGF
uniref:Uncharacterized protein n=1 Tax=Arundo donax TaxID=35708 RepID=A0A0A9EJW6_ARUDO